MPTAELIVLLVVEALIVQLMCTLYEWRLVTGVENARLVALLAMLGLPGPVLRQMTCKDTKVCRAVPGFSHRRSRIGRSRIGRSRIGRPRLRDSSVLLKACCISVPMTNAVASAANSNKCCRCYCHCHCCCGPGF
jgi:hypothetical protein